MEALFEVHNIVSDWRPPFGKKSERREFGVNENQSFDSLSTLDGDVFRLIKIAGNRALIQYHHQFTLKNYEHPQNKQIWVNLGEAVSFTFLWGDKGITKKLKFKGFGPVKVKEPAPSQIEDIPIIHEKVETPIIRKELETPTIIPSENA
ncbi:MAG: hypothetical protein ABID38_01775 [Candidatus Diapherotrites archaeon]